MNRAVFLSDLRQGLYGLAPQEIEDIIADYDAHFSEGLAAGRDEAEIAAALGDPVRLARELRAEAGFRRWESERSAGNLAGAVLALLGLATLDIIFLLPIVCAIVAFLVAMAGVAVGLVCGGVALCLLALFPSLPFFGHFGFFGHGLPLALAGLGLIAAAIGLAALTWLLLDIVARALVNYARLHFRLIDSTNPRRD